MRALVAHNLFLWQKQGKESYVCPLYRSTNILAHYASLWTLEELWEFGFHFDICAYITLCYQLLRADGSNVCYQIGCTTPNKVCVINRCHSNNFLHIYIFFILSYVHISCVVISFAIIIKKKYTKNISEMKREKKVTWQIYILKILTHDCLENAQFLWRILLWRTSNFSS